MSVAIRPLQNLVRPNTLLQPPADEITQPARSNARLTRDEARRIGCQQLFGGGSALPLNAF